MSENWQDHNGPVFAGQKLVVVGGSSGMGRQTAADVVAGGGSAVIIGDDQAKVDDTVKELGQDGSAYGITADLGPRHAGASSGYGLEPSLPVVQPLRGRLGRGAFRLGEAFPPGGRPAGWLASQVMGAQSPAQLADLTVCARGAAAIVVRSNQQAQPGAVSTWSCGTR